ncbi:MAG: hypothetical protein B6U72_06890 [Candidatus Altiarchaeales archaeon ex4484_2]|nr:MAG: hypothetical protein B6U72_06890 [Candidatus Altiarchaeales archaeon ex4484_2]
MEKIALMLVFASSFLFTLFFAPKYMKKAREKNYTVKDMYKRDKPEIPSIGGLIILAALLTSLVVALILVNLIGVETITALIILYFLILVYGLFGLADDLFQIGHSWKIIVPYFLAMPIVALMPESTINLYYTEINPGIWYLFLIAPMYIMVTSNLINMHSGYNGLACGLSYIILSFIMIRVFFESGAEKIFMFLPLFGSLLAFIYYETYPARIFWGNTGSLMTGAALGAFLVVNKLELFGVVILLPHIINFLMYVVWKIKKLGDVKFGTLREDNTLEVPNHWTLKWFFPYHLRLTEHQSMWILYGLTTLSGIMGLILVPY